MSAAAGPPLPPVELMRRVAPLDSDRDEASDYEAAGLRIKQFICSQLPADWSWDGKRVLDFGCGAGRVLRHFASRPRAASSGAARSTSPASGGSSAASRLRSVSFSATTARRFASRTVTST